MLQIIRRVLDFSIANGEKTVELLLEQFNCILKMFLIPTTSVITLKREILGKIKFYKLKILSYYCCLYKMNVETNINEDYVNRVDTRRKQNMY